MDGYIKHKKEAIASIRKTILSKYATTLLIVILIPFWLFVIAANQAPEKWTHTEIVFSHISYERIGFQRGRCGVLNTQDGRKYVINSNIVNIDQLSSNLVPGCEYFLVYSNSGTVAGGDIMEALSDEYVVFQDIDASISQWEKEQQETVVAILVTFIIEIIALVLIDRLWCKKEYSQIQKLKEDIQRRENHLMSR